MAQVQSEPSGAEDVVEPQALAVWDVGQFRV